MRFNINEKVKCILTDEGEKVLKSKALHSYKSNYNQVRHELTEQLWVIMNIFGDEFYNGGKTMFVDNVIEL